MTTQEPFFIGAGTKRWAHACDPMGSHVRADGITHVNRWDHRREPKKW